MHASHQPIGWGPYTINPHAYAQQHLANGYAWMYPTYYYSPSEPLSPNGYHSSDCFPRPYVKEEIKPVLHALTEQNQDGAMKRKCVNLCADYCNRTHATSPSLYEARDDDLDSVLSRSSNGSLSPPYRAPPLKAPHLAPTSPWVEPLSRWLSTHRHRPYPTKREKHRLAEMSGRSVEEISVWLSSARRALKHKTDDDDECKARIATKTAADLPDSWRLTSELAERRHRLTLQPVVTSMEAINDSLRVMEHLTSAGDVPRLSTPSPTPPHNTNDHKMPTLVPEVAEASERCSAQSPDLFLPLVMDVDRLERRTSCDVALAHTQSTDVSETVANESPNPDKTDGISFVNYKKRMLERFLREKPIIPTSGSTSTEKRLSGKELNTLELSAVSALISMGSTSILSYANS